MRRRFSNDSKNLTFLLEWFLTCNSRHALSPATIIPPTTFPCAQIFPYSPTTTASGSALPKSSPQLSRTCTSFLHVTSRFSPFQNTLTLARSSYLIVARSDPKLIDGGEEAGSGMRKRKVEIPRRAWWWCGGRGGSPGKGCAWTALDGGSPGPWKSRLLCRKVDVAEWSRDVSSVKVESIGDT